jgi:hypothetical protein
MGKTFSLAIVVFALLIPATAASALGTPLETAASPVKDVITQVATTLPPIVPVRPPAPVSLPTTPAETPTASDQPSKSPVEPPVSPVSVDVPNVKAPSSPKTPSSPQSQPPIDPLPDQSPSPVAEAPVSGTAEVVGETTQTAGIDPGSEAAGQPASGFRPAVGAAGASGSAAVLRAPLVAPFRQLLVYIWPAVALGRPGLVTLLDRAGLGLATLVAAGRAGFGSGVETASGRERVPADGIGVADWLSPRFYALGDRFVPDPPLSLAALYLILAAGIAAIWCISRREVGLRTLSRRRRI